MDVHPLAWYVYVILLLPIMLGSKEFPVTFVPEKNPPAGLAVNVIGDVPEHVDNVDVTDKVE